ncbi:MAG: hypothetical protein WAM71_20130 [Candidatus Korobacteraceae bacterium]
MKTIAFGRTAFAITVLVLAVNACALAQNTQFSGTINAYSPQTKTTGPYEVRGSWSLTLKGNSGKADFSAALNMELSDGWVLTLGNGNFDPDARGAHTHHITLVDGEVSPFVGANGLKITGVATVTLNGNPAPVSPTPIEIDITGGNDVEFSNVQMIFGSPGSKHFGTEPLPGVVQNVSNVQ